MVFCFIVLLAFLATAELNPVSVMAERGRRLVRLPKETLEDISSLSSSGAERKGGRAKRPERKGRRESGTFISTRRRKAGVKRIHGGGDDTPPEDEEDHAARKSKGRLIPTISSFLPSGALSLFGGRRTSAPCCSS